MRFRPEPVLLWRSLESLAPLVRVWGETALHVEEEEESGEGHEEAQGVCVLQ